MSNDTTPARLDAIIEGHRNQNGILCPFDQADWNAYAGCESSDPLIARFEWGDVIVDGCFVGACVLVDDEPAYNTEFPTEAAALVIARAIKSPNDAGEILGEAV